MQLLCGYKLLVGNTSNVTDAFHLDNVNNKLLQLLVEFDCQNIDAEDIGFNIPKSCHKLSLDVQVSGNFKACLVDFDLRY